MNEVIRKKIVELLILPPNWDSYEAKPIVLEIGQIAGVLATVIAETIVMPTIIPTTCGDIQLEWTKNGVHFEVTISAVSEKEST